MPPQLGRNVWPFSAGFTGLDNPTLIRGASIPFLILSIGPM
jgi:hypothetical protein